jgi:hypothetical protein
MLLTFFELEARFPPYRGESRGLAFVVEQVRVQASELAGYDWRDPRLRTTVSSGSCATERTRLTDRYRGADPRVQTDLSDHRRSPQSYGLGFAATAALEGITGEALAQRTGPVTARTWRPLGTGTSGSQGWCVNLLSPPCVAATSIGLRMWAPWTSVCRAAGLARRSRSRTRASVLSWLRGCRSGRDRVENERGTSPEFSLGGTASLQRVSVPRCAPARRVGGRAWDATGGGRGISDPRCDRLTLGLSRLGAQVNSPSTSATYAFARRNASPRSSRP